MYKRGSIILIFLVCCELTFAQKNAQPLPVIVAGKVLSIEDSINVKELFFAALKQKIVENYDESSEILKQILTIDPANDAAMYELANVYHVRNRQEDAEQLARKAVTVKPDNEWYWLLLADIYKRTANFQQLTSVYEELSKLAPQKDEYYFNKANALLFQNKTDEALAVYSGIETKFGLTDDLINARQRVYQKQGKTGEAASDLEGLIKSKPSDISNYIRLSELYTAAGDKDKAIGILQKAKSMDQGNAFVNLSLADIYRLQGKDEDALTELKAAFGNSSLNIDAKVRILLSFFPKFRDPAFRAQADELAATLVKVHSSEAKAYSVYGDILYQEQKLPEAKAAYKKALEINNEVYAIWRQLLTIEIALSDFDSAIKDGEEALTIFPNQADLYFYTGMGYSQVKNYAKAISYFNNAISMQSDDKELTSQIYSALGDSYNATKKYKESDESYEKSLQIDPQNTYTLNNYSYYLSLRGENLDKAEQMSRKSNDLEKGNASFEDTYAWILFRQKKYKEARTWMEKALVNEKSGSSVQSEHYGDILFHLGETELAVTQWKKSKEQGSTSEKLDRKINEKKYIE